MRGSRRVVLLAIVAISGCTASYDAYRSEGASAGDLDPADERDARATSGNRNSRPGSSVTWSSESHGRGIGSGSYSSERGVLIVDPDR